MPVIWDNPCGHNIIATRRCKACGEEGVRTLWSRPWEFANEAFASCLEETPLTIPDIGSMLKDAPFKCTGCGGADARIVALSMDTTSIPF
ncbi:hypothetical protein ASF39_15560 [Methylobacterium sp. Leaf108]|nr:hypothetical protein ASF39_15560 [Methylobacterium sp. Leaf108]